MTEFWEAYFILVACLIVAAIALPTGVRALAPFRIIADAANVLGALLPMGRTLSKHDRFVNAQHRKLHNNQFRTGWHPLWATSGDLTSQNATIVENGLQSCDSGSGE